MSVPLTIGFLSDWLGGYYHGNIIKGMHQVARQQGVQLLAIQASHDQHLFALNQVDGWVLLLQQEDQAFQTIVGGCPPVVTIGCRALDHGQSFVNFENRASQAAAVEHLIAHGHTRIAFVVPLTLADTLSEDMQDRLSGYHDALMSHQLPIDPSLVLMIEENDAPGAYLEPGGHAGVRRLLAAGMPCTAIVGADDLIAIGVIEALQAAGYRVPEDIAVVGFDDIDRAQRCTPPLTTIRSHIPTLGTTAASALLNRLADPGQPAAAHLLPTALIQRRSCGCEGAAFTLRSPLPETATAEGWQTALIVELVQIVSYPIPLDPATSPDQIWPGVLCLLEGLYAVLDDRPLPADTALQQAWLEAIALAENVELLQAIIRLIQQAAEARLAASSDRRRARARLRTFVERMQSELLRASQIYEQTRIQNLNQLIRTNYTMSMTLLAAAPGEARQLAWLAPTSVRWACLAVWEQPEDGGTPELVVAGVFGREGQPAPTLAVGERYAAAAFPPLDRLPAWGLGDEPDLVKLIPIGTAARAWGVLVVCSPMENWLFTNDENAMLWAAELGAALDHEAITAELESRKVQRQIQEAIIAAQHHRIKELSTPVIPISDAILVLPLIGTIDSARAAQIMDAMLRAITLHRSQALIMDITGVCVVDTEVAQHLLQAAQAASLLGTTVILVGITPEVAQMLVQLGVDLSQIVTRSTLQVGLEYANAYLRKGLKNHHAR